jgi:hypothetical protein
LWSAYFVGTPESARADEHDCSVSHQPIDEAPHRATLPEAAALGHLAGHDVGVSGDA